MNKSTLSEDTLLKHVANLNLLRLDLSQQQCPGPYSKNVILHHHYVMQNLISEGSKVSASVATANNHSVFVCIVRPIREIHGFDQAENKIVFIKGINIRQFYSLCHRASIPICFITQNYKQSYISFKIIQVPRKTVPLKPFHFHHWHFH